MSIEAVFDEHARVIAQAREVLPGMLGQVIERAADCLLSGGKILVCGNGGSAADAQHLAAELICRFAFDRSAFPAIALTTDTSALTAIANDLGYENVFSRQVEGLAHPGDILIAISTSGTSPNVVAAAHAARKKSCAVIALTGKDGGPLAEIADLAIAAPSLDVARIQEVHGLAIHIIAGRLEEVLCSRRTDDE